MSCLLVSSCMSASHFCDGPQLASHTVPVSVLGLASTLYSISLMPTGQPRYPGTILSTLCDTDSGARDQAIRSIETA